MLDAGHADRAVAYAAKGHDRILNKVLRAAYMAEPGNDVGFQEMVEFINNNPDWPNLRGIVAIAEQKIPPQMSAEDTVKWFASHPAVTLVGFYRSVDALESLGRTQDATQLVRERLINGDFSAEELSAFYARFNRYFDADSMNARLDRLDWKNDVFGARRMYGYVDVAHRNLSEARLSYANRVPHPESADASVPAELADDPGLLFERLRWLQRNNRDDDAVEMLRHAPDDLGDPEAWWEVRQIMVRRMMDRHDYATAYELAANHGQKDPKTLAPAEFLAGWLALRFLNQPDKAERHFAILSDNATTPVTRARAAYWLGRAHEVLGGKSEAEQFYEDAAALNITYYGQLAASRLSDNPTIEARPEPAVPAAVRTAFFARDNISTIEKLHDIGEDGRAGAFFHAATEAAPLRADFALLMELAYRIHRPDLAIEAAKAANQKNMLVGAGGFPLLDRILPRPPEPAFTHALIRQESMFNPKAESPVGAEGLMQLMPHTAKAVAKQCGIKYKEARLCDLDYNLRLGTAFIQSQLNMFNGSYVLTLAAYNAGPGRVREWMEQIGDPRSPNVDPVDWVEEIPVAETRNYVQRVIESLEVYRAKLDGGKAPLTILADLRR
jgi:soluble lytic murein transglycosylase